MDVITAIGPGSTLLPNTTTEGYQPVSRNGEVTQNAYIDGFLWNAITDRTRWTKPKLRILRDEKDPAFHEWASVQPGFLCVFEKNRSTRFRMHASAETACPVLACSQLMDDKDDRHYHFAGVARSKSVRDYDDIANGAKRDEFFTLHIGGPCTIINNGNEAIKAGDMVEWTFFDRRQTRNAIRKQKVGPRRLQVRTAKNTHARAFGRALNYAKRGESMDVLVGSASM
jgi:hypothetical protein